MTYIDPGEILQIEFLEPMNIISYRLSKDIHLIYAAFTQF